MIKRGSSNLPAVGCRGCGTASGKMKDSEYGEFGASTGHP